ncbi:MAG: D-alanyl-D-alanine carboxypeptidase [Fimbriimonadaceae bacterium]|nr:D-alanyl-D-alanine carboxypeptidase [Fimbriimonadaceae bacterium]QYK55645.1 MAG: D-alanyl-D-alanine carboxypeptidase [Fimbriimonadaceae bacterium]
MAFRALPLSLLLFPAIASAQAPVTVRAASAIVVDAETGAVLYSKNADLKRPPASCTKIMTALLLQENTLPSDPITAPPGTKKVGGSRLNLAPGETLTAAEMLDALMIKSANDVAHAIATKIAGGDAGFARLMNRRAKELGCRNTNFCNPHGLPNPNHYTTAADLATIARAAIRYPEIAGASTADVRVLNRRGGTATTVLKNRNPWITKTDGAIGLKTGWTTAAGHCFVGAARRGEMAIVTVVLKSPDWVGDTARLVDWAYENFESRLVATKGEKVAEVKVQGGDSPSVALVASRDVRIVVPLSQPTPEWLLPEAVTAPIAKNQTVATGRLTLFDGTSWEVGLYAGEAVALPHGAAGLDRMRQDK